ncbi:MAG: hypothetical protein OIN66_17425 [Candidatus Methanoperedens sp.]|nr:hypothetical protein [Candidatus Methanoperedens sp.]
MAVTLILVAPALADINQKSKMTGDNVIDIKVKQTAWNYGSGNINQDINVFATGNYQMISQDNIVLISDPDYAGDINNTMNGVNLIRLNLDQYSRNMGRGNVAQGIDVAIEGNVQILDQNVILAISGD